MKKVLMIAALLFSAAGTVQAQAYNMGLGVRFGNAAAAVNNSISFKYFLSEKTAVETLLSFGSPLALGLLVEKHKPLLSNRFNWYAGGGGYLAFGSAKAGQNRNAGLQGVLGLDYKLPMLPLNFSIDWKPELNIAREFSFEPAAIGVGARFTFK